MGNYFTTETPLHLSIQLLLFIKISLYIDRMDGGVKNISVIPRVLGIIDSRVVHGSLNA